jgi:predicted ester cyclase
MKAILRIGFLLLAVAAAPAAIADEAGNAALARKFYDAINNRNLNSLDGIVAKDFVDHMADPDQPLGIEGLRQSLVPFLASSSDLKFINDPVIAKGDYVTVVDTISGTNDGQIMGMAATQKPFKFNAIDIWLVKDGKLAEVWHVEQILQMLMQLGGDRAKAIVFTAALSAPPRRGTHFGRFGGGKTSADGFLWFRRTLDAHARRDRPRASTGKLRVGWRRMLDRHSTGRDDRRVAGVPQARGPRERGLTADTAETATRFV